MKKQAVFLCVLSFSIFPSWVSASDSIGKYDVEIGGEVMSGGCRFNPLDSHIIDFGMYPSNYFYPNSQDGNKETPPVETRVQLVCSNLPSSAISIHFTSDRHLESMQSNEIETGVYNLSAFVQMNGKDVSFNSSSGEVYEVSSNNDVITLSTTLRSTGVSTYDWVSSGMVNTYFTIYAEYR